MAVATHIPVKWQLAQGLLTTNQTIDLDGDTFKGLWVVAGAGLPSMTSSGIQFVGGGGQCGEQSRGLKLASG